MRPYVPVNTATAAATTSTQSSPAPTSAAVPTSAANDTTTISSAQPLHLEDVIAHDRAKCNSHIVVDGADIQGVIKTKRSYDDAKKAFLNYSPSDNYVYSNLFVNKSKSPSFASSPPQQQRTQSLWSTQLPDPSQPKRCIDSTTTKTSTSTTTTTVELPSDNKRKYSSAEQSMLISDKTLSLSPRAATSFDTVNSNNNSSPSSTTTSAASSKSNNRLPFIVANANSKTVIDGCEVSRVKFVHCDNSFVDGRSSRVGAGNEQKSGSGRTSSSMLLHQNHTLNDIPNKCAGVVKPMSNSLNSSNCETTSKCQISSNSEERTALLIGNDPSKSITVRKAGNASLIFTKKDSNPVVHRKKNVYLRASSSGSRSTLTAPSADTAGDTSSSKRHSFHWQDHNDVSSDERKRKQVKSWYAIISSADSNESADEHIEVSAIGIRSVIQTDFQLGFFLSFQEQFLNYNNLAGTKDANAKASHEMAALLDQPQLHQSWRVGGKQQAAPTIRPANFNEMVSNGRETVSKYNRFEQLLKNLVGRKVSREATAVAATTKMPTTTATSPITAPPPPSSFSRQSSTISVEAANQYPDATTINRKPNGDIDAKQNHLIFSSPEIQVTRTPSVSNLLRSDNHMLVDSTSGSTTSLNSTVQRKLWHVMPLLRREDSCTSLYQNSTKPLIHQHHKSTMSGLKKCETVLTLSHSQTTSSFEPIKAQNRLRHSQTIATCSRCSSILSLAANGSRYSLNLASGGGFVAINNNNNSAAGSNAACSDKATLLNCSASSAAISCKLCLCDANDENVTTIQLCGCKFCTEVSEREPPSDCVATFWNQF